ncbi:Unknown protein sequence, partial [Pseudomonas syringae pv. rhaphiolepidis]
AGCPVRDQVAFVVLRGDVTLGLQRAQRFTHRHTADLKGIGDGLLRKPFTRFKPSIHDGFAKRFFYRRARQRYGLCNAEGNGFKHVLRVQLLRSAVTHLRLLSMHANRTLRRRAGLGAAQG